MDRANEWSRTKGAPSGAYQLGFGAEGRLGRARVQVSPCLLTGRPESARSRLADCVSVTWLWGVIAGTLVGIVVTALVKPLTEYANKLSEALWGFDPVYVHVERDQRLIWANYPPWLSFAYAFPDGLPTEPRPAISFDAWQWAHRNGGFDLGLSMMQVTIQARSDVSIVIEDVLIRNTRTDRRAKVGVLFAAAGGAEVDPRRLDVDLDAFDPPVVDFIWAPNEEPGPVPALQLGTGQVERFHIWVKADASWNEWHIHLPLLVNGRRIDKFIGSARKPFVTVGWSAVEQTSRAETHGTWSDNGDI